MKSIKETKRSLLDSVRKKYGVYSVNEFTKKCYELAASYKDFFFDVLTNVIEQYYIEQEENKNRS